MKFVVTSLMHMLSHADILFAFDIITASQPVDANATNVLRNLFGEFTEECSRNSRVTIACSVCSEGQFFLSSRA